MRLRHYPVEKLKKKFWRLRGNILIVRHIDDFEFLLRYNLFLLHDDTSMEIVITDHAKERMLLRKITKKMIEAAIANPDRTGMGYQNRLLSFKSFQSEMLRVVYSR